MDKKPMRMCYPCGIMIPDGGYTCPKCKGRTAGNTDAVQKPKKIIYAVGR